MTWTNEPSQGAGWNYQWSCCKHDVFFNRLSFSFHYASYPLQYFVILEYDPQETQCQHGWCKWDQFDHDLLLHSHLKWHLDHFYRTSEWPSTDPGMEMVVNLQQKHMVNCNGLFTVPANEETFNSPHMVQSNESLVKALKAFTVPCRQLTNTVEINRLETINQCIKAAHTVFLLCSDWTTLILSFLTWTLIFGIFLIFFFLNGIATVK